MIRFFVLIGLVGGIVVAYLTTLGVGEIAQLPPKVSLLEGFREKGYLPESASLEEDHAAEDMEVFEVPEEDEAQLEAAEAAFEEMMGDMDMGNMNMGTTGGMNMGGESGSTMNMGSGEGGTMNMTQGSGESGSTMNMGTTTTQEGGGTMNMAEGSTGSGSTMNMGTTTQEGGSTMNMAEGSESTGTMNMAQGSGESGSTMNMNMGTTTQEGSGTMNMAGGETGGDGEAGHGEEAMMPEGGLLVTDDAKYTREITLDMAEWKFSEMNIDVKMGERIKFTVRNMGQIPHEFMFMTPPLMQAVTYRGTRADWSLFEHEALFEQALVLPGGEFSFVLQVTQPGSWMFMCMLPYHMQMGMMGQMATEGMAMDMDM